jgi:hypothetical protein
MDGNEAAEQRRTRFGLCAAAAALTPRWTNEPADAFIERV